MVVHVLFITKRGEWVGSKTEVKVFTDPVDAKAATYDASHSGCDVWLCLDQEVQD